VSTRTVLHTFLHKSSPFNSPVSYLAVSFTTHTQRMNAQKTPCPGAKVPQSTALCYQTAALTEIISEVSTK